MLTFVSLLRCYACWLLCFAIRNIGHLPYYSYTICKTLTISALLSLYCREYDIFNSRDCIKKTFEAKDGLANVSKLALGNAQDLAPLIYWNEAHGIRLFRLSSCIFPWMTFYHMEDLPDWQEIKQVGAELSSGVSSDGATCKLICA